MCGRIGVAAVVVVLALQVTEPELLARVAVPLALAGIVLGVPHGAVDHMVPFWTGGRRPDRVAMTRVLAGYLLVAAVAAACLVLAPAPTVLAFLAVSAGHFGRAEVTAAAERAGRPVPGGATDLAPALAHGLAVVVLPVALWPAESAVVLGWLSPALGNPLPAGARAVLGLLVAGLTVLAVVGLLRRHRAREAAELALVVALFVVVPPLAAFGVYFAGWHAVRHTGRLLGLPGPDGVVPGPAAGVRRLALHAALPTAVSLAAVLVLVGPATTPAAVSGALAVLVALTFPHVRTVAALDRWSADRPVDPSGWLTSKDG